MTCKCKNELFLVKFTRLEYPLNDSVEFRLVSAENRWDAEDKIIKAFESRDVGVVIENIEVLDTVE